MPEALDPCPPFLEAPDFWMVYGAWVPAGRLPSCAFCCLEWRKCLPRPQQTLCCIIAYA